MDLGDSGMVLLDDDDANMAAVTKLKHFQEFRRLLNVGFKEFEGHYMDLLTGFLLVATFHTSTFSRTNNIVCSSALASLANSLSHVIDSHVLCRSMISRFIRN
jgi:hypothetical protein